MANCWQKAPSRTITVCAGQALNPLCAWLQVSMCCHTPGLLTVCHGLRPATTLSRDCAALLAIRAVSFRSRPHTLSKHTPPHYTKSQTRDLYTYLRVGPPLYMVVGPVSVAAGSADINKLCSVAGCRTDSLAVRVSVCCCETLDACLSAACGIESQPRASIFLAAQPTFHHTVRHTFSHSC